MKPSLVFLLIFSLLISSACSLEDDDNEGDYSVQGDLFSLDGELILNLNGNEELIILNESGNDARQQFSFRQKMYAGDDIQVSIVKQPESQYCRFFENPNIIGQTFLGTVENQDFVEMNIDCLSYNRISNQPQSLSLGYFHTCLIDGDGARCRGRDWHHTENVNITELPIGLSNPKDITSSVYHGCVIDDTGIVCWGDEDKALVPSNLVNPRELQVGEGFSCALDDEGLKCWGWELLASRVTFNIENATNLTVGRASACILDNGKPVCRATSDSSITVVPEILDSVSYIYIHESTACAIQDKKLYCWGGLVNPDTYGVELNADLSFIELAFNASCLANEKVIACTDNPIGSLMEDMTNLMPDAKSVEIGIYHVCAMNNDDILCFGNNFANPDSILPSD